MHRLGTIDWADTSRGLLSRGDRIVQITQSIGLRARAAFARIFGTGAVARLDPDAIVIPDSKISREAVELCEAHSAPWLVNHCYRAYAWGALLAQAGAIRHDAELFWVTAILHDLGLTDAYDYDEATRPQRCFAHRGALAAESFARDRGWDDARSRTLGDAICLHLNVRVSLDDGPEAHLVRQGSAFDVIGARFGEIAADDRRAVLERWPRLGFKGEIGAAARREWREQPGCRMHFLVANGFATMIDRSPFSD